MDGLVGLPDLFDPTGGGVLGWLTVPPVFSVVLVPALTVWLPLLRRRVVLAWGLFACATLFVLRDALRFVELPANDGYLPLERLALGATLWPWAAALALVAAYRMRGRAGPASTGGRTLVVLVVFAPFLVALVVFGLLPVLA